MNTNSNGQDWTETYLRSKVELNRKLVADQLDALDYIAGIRELERMNAYHTALTPEEQEELHRWERAHLGNGQTGTSDWPGWEVYGLQGFGSTPLRRGQKPTRGAAPPPTRP